jgi:hypothetical protein
VDLREAAVLGGAQRADRGDDVDAELGPGQDQPPLLLGMDRRPESPAVAVPAAADLEAEADHHLWGGNLILNTFFTGFRDARRGGNANI